MKRASRKVITTTEMVASATELYIGGNSRMLREIVGQRVDGIIWGTQRVERQVLVAVLEIHIKECQSAEATAVLRGICQFIEEMPFFVPS